MAEGEGTGLGRAMSHFSGKVRVVAFLIFITMLSAACSLKLGQVGDQEAQPDPMTLLRREIRQLRIDHRVALFDLQKDLNAQVERLRADLKKEAAEKEKDQFALRKRDADFAEQIAEIDMQVRILGGSFEEQINRVKEFSDQKNSEAIRDLAEMRGVLAKKEKQEALAEQNLQNKIAGQLKEEGDARKSLQDQIDSMRAFDETLQQSSNDQIKALKAVSEQLSELIDKVLPAVNTLSQRVDRQEEQFKALNRKPDAAGLDGRLSDLAKVVEAQRKTLEILGNTLTAQVDKQQKQLQQATDRLQALEAKGPSAKK